MCYGDPQEGHLRRDGLQTNKNGTKKTKNTGLQTKQNETMAHFDTVNNL